MELTTKIHHADLCVVGGGLAGIPGMLFGVPLAATLYRLISIDVKRRTEIQHDQAKCNETEE